MRIFRKLGGRKDQFNQHSNNPLPKLWYKLRWYVIVILMNAKVDKNWHN